MGRLARRRPPCRGGGARFAAAQFLQANIKFGMKPADLDFAALDSWTARRVDDYPPFPERSEHEALGVFMHGVGPPCGAAGAA